MISAGGAAGRDTQHRLLYAVERERRRDVSRGTDCRWREECCQLPTLCRSSWRGRKRDRTGRVRGRRAEQTHSVLLLVSNTTLSPHCVVSSTSLRLRPATEFTPNRIFVPMSVICWQLHEMPTNTKNKLNCSTAEAIN